MVTRRRFLITLPAVAAGAAGERRRLRGGRGVRRATTAAAGGEEGGGGGTGRKFEDATPGNLFLRHLVFSNSAPRTNTLASSQLTAKQTVTSAQFVRRRESIIATHALSIRTREHSRRHRTR